MDDISIKDDRLNDLICKRFPLEEDAASSAAVSKEKQSRKGRKKKVRSNEEWRELLLDVYTHMSIAKSSNQPMTIKSYCKNILRQEQQYRRLCDVWKDLRFDDDLKEGICHSDKKIMNKLSQKYPLDKDKGSTGIVPERNLAPKSLSYFDKHDEDAMCEAVAGFARLGYPLEKGNLRDICNEYLRKDAPGCLGSTGISDATIERIYKDDNIRAKSNVNPIDPKRAAQADPQVLNYFYHQLEAAVAMAHEVNPEVWPEDRFANVPPTCIYNCDEQGPNPTKLCNAVLIPSDMLQAPRLYQNTREGDGKMKLHYSVANIVRADGVCIVLL